MTEQTKVTTLEKVVVRFSGDSGDGMQLTGTIFSNLSAILGNEISTFPDFPAEIRAPQGSLSGVSGFQVHLGSKKIFTPGDKADVLVAMNPAALKVNVNYLKPLAIVVIDTDSFQKSDLDKAKFTTDDPFKELGLTNVQVIAAPISSMVKDGLAEFGLDNKSAVRCKNMFALGLVCWLFDRPLDEAMHMLQNKFAKKPTIAQANIKALTDGYNYGHNTHALVSTYRIESKKMAPGFYTDVNGNKATAYGLIAAAEKAGLKLFLGSYPITPATDILQELSARKDLGVKALQFEDEIAGICTSIGASFAGSLAATSTSGPGLALKSEAIGLAVIAEIPLVVVDVQRGGPSTGLPTKSEQTDLAQALYGRNGESPVVVIAASTPTDCFDAAFWAGKLALEHMTPVILLTDSFLANGSSAWKLPDMKDYPEIKPKYATEYKGDTPWKAYHRDPETLVRYWAVPGMEGFAHRIGGLEKDYDTSAISTDPHNHQKMVTTRQAKIDKIADYIPEVEVLGDKDADLLIVGWGGTFGHLCEAMETMHENGKKVALAHFKFISPLPKNTAEVLLKYKKVVVAEQNNGQFANYLRSKISGFNPYKFNRVKGQPFIVSRLVEEFTKLLEA
ncbi:2-oxoglutarate ferredoxin oxidoreductase subunit alpha [Parabacteroides sp. PF5-5]|uniref:2-oxoacid:acceptor oxidoreductase subunit alpha n=1 Tax=unclassified Parabacteroides TaxID=2649774 RepID=UPI00247343B9|nr:MULTISPECIES: 2-oxoacid:acceptor oxidoreductase subunit alpha [unclassified Parabacteroides]MDH6305995.1 2-oxoglutarate ferredoxin oxidoreductase subunit alpha [Parabacteroides sp. PH5-39]MDH6317251.1 2-oxoglutarate ferredoxin oxidoreductase subunit alpha [Parabacteroides sp. PF5-13]MDH6320707.1 2-oxoglutarate ferredoxin oxidoreductase subunit alpha [Parabacteroides sp. PH5-13]MDH6324372.1 2-oxoglutarate ferredoxin oxidoreductase subunit alpha [Parabacteroides sp. PH5-8]MDH6328436.1 2-oxogl